MPETLREVTDQIYTERLTAGGATLRTMAGKLREGTPLNHFEKMLVKRVYGLVQREDGMWVEVEKETGK